jgi:putative spermidine/putrescine transport system substrate-binding protein
VQWANLGGGGEDNIDPGFEYAQSLMDNMHTVHTWSSELANLMQLGEVWLGTTGSNMAPALRDQGMAVRWVAPSDGAPMVNGGLSIVKDAPCQEEAHAFINHYYSDEFQALRMRDGGVVSPSRSAWQSMTDSDQEGMDLTLSDFDVLVQFDWQQINENRPQWIERWQREIR